MELFTYLDLEKTSSFRKDSTAFNLQEWHKSAQNGLPWLIRIATMRAQQAQNIFIPLYYLILYIITLAALFLNMAALIFINPIYILFFADMA